jgi:hypothetical protein
MRWLFLLLGLATACAAPPSAVQPHADPGPRLRAVGEDLFVSAAPDRYPRGALLYVLSVDAVPGSQTHPRIGLVQVTEPRPVKVTWYCRPKVSVVPALPAGGLPVEDFAPDTTLRVGKCWGRSLGQNESAWDQKKAGDPVDLELNLGEGDGVKVGDTFEILGEPHTDNESRTVTGFERLGLCSILPFEGSMDRSVCKLDRSLWPKFSRQWWTRGGFARLAPKDDGSK